MLYPRAASALIMPTLWPKVHTYNLLWAICNHRVRLQTRHLLCTWSLRVNPFGLDFAMDDALAFLNEAAPRRAQRWLLLELEGPAGVLVR